MRTWLCVLVGIACSSGVDLSAQRELQFFASFTDAAGDPVTDVSTAAFSVFEDGVQGRVLAFDPIDWPTRVTILVDNGFGMDSHLLQIRNGVSGLIEALPEGIEASLLTMAPQPRWVVRPTTDRNALLAGVSLIIPDQGGARFVDAMREVAERIAESNSNFFPVIVALGSTGVENAYVSDRELDRMVLRFAEGAATVHVVMLTTRAPLGSTIAGTFQTEVGIALSTMTGGRYEALAAASRIATLLPEIGAQVARSQRAQSRQYRVIFERPEGRRGDLGRIGVSTADGLYVRLSMDGHLP